MDIAVDTNKLSDFFGGVKTALQAFSAADSIYIPCIVLSEYKSGAYAGSKREHNLKLLSQLLAKPNVRVLDVDQQTADHYAELKYYTRKKGTPIPVNDIWIGALSVQYDLPLLTRDSDFDYLPQVRRV